jgi:hypothetical protein
MLHTHTRALTRFNALTLTNMSNKPTPPAPESVNPLPSEIQKLTPKQTAVQIVEQSSIANRAFITVAMLLLHLKPTLKPGQTLGGLVIKLADVANGARRRVKSTIDNARYAMRVWEELVVPGHITVEKFNDFTFGDCLTINKVMSGASRQKVTGSDTALILEASPTNWHEELDCLFTYGQTLEDRAAVEAKQASKKTAKSEDEGGSTAPSGDDTKPEGGTTDDGETPGASPDAPKPAETAEPAEGKIVPMPKQAATSDDAIKLIAALEAVIAGLPRAEVAKVAPALAELNDAVQTSIAPKKAAKHKQAKKAA